MLCSLKTDVFDALFSEFTFPLKTKLPVTVPAVVGAIIHSLQLWEGIFGAPIWTMLVVSCRSISTAPTRRTWSWESTDKREA